MMMYVTTALALLSLISSSPIPYEERGLGRVMEPYGVVRDLDLPALMHFDGDVFRFSSTPALGGRGYVITISGIADGAGRLEVITVEGHSSFGWRRTGAFETLLSPEEYAGVMNWVDALYQEPEDYEEKAPDPNAPIFICGDGPGFLSERRRGNRISWLDGSCAPDHPNKAISQYLFGYTQELMGSFWNRKWRYGRQGQ